MSGELPCRLLAPCSDLTLHRAADALGLELVVGFRQQASA